MFEQAWATFQANIWLYLSMPITSGLVGYVTNVIAIKMMFKPLEFIGVWKPYLGWQGIFPRKVAKMSTRICDTLVPDLVTEKEIFDRLDLDRIVQLIEQPIIRLIDQLAAEVMQEHEPELWEVLPGTVKKRILERVKARAPDVVGDVMRQMREDIESVLDLKGMIINQLINDKELINRIFADTGHKEFRFIGHCGFYLGFVFGIFQMIGWTFYQSDWQLPLFGLIVGWATNWIALQMIFRPLEPRKLGPMTLQGLFFKRQGEISQDYATLIEAEILTPANLIEAVLKGSYADRVFSMINRTVQEAIDEQSGIAKSFVAIAIGTKRYRAMKDAVVDRLVARLDEPLKHVESYAREAMSIREILAARLGAMTTVKFEGLLRPAFKEDEAILIAVGAALGCCVGIGQVIVFKAMATVPDPAAAMGLLPGLG